MDTRKGAVSNPVAFTITAAGISPLSISTSSLPDGQVAKSYSATLSATGGTSPYSWSVASGGLPPGLALSSAGAISGTPTAAGEYYFSAKAVDSASPPQAATTALRIVAAPPPLAITTSSLPTATVNTVYSTTLAGTGGTTPYSWTVVSGALPSGLTLSSSTGVISGKATVTGTFPFTVQLADSTGASTTRSLSLVVAAQTTTTYRRFYADTSFWNTPIPANPQIDPNSAAIVSKAISAYAGGANFANTDKWGIGLTYATSTSKTYKVACTRYCTGDTIYFKIPDGATPSTGSDLHLGVVDGDKQLDMYRSLYDAATDNWSAGARVVNDTYGWGATCALGQHCNGAVASGFALLGGAVRPEEIAQGRIDHALSITSPYTRATYIACPATHTDGKYDDPAAIPLGARIQLDPAFDVDAQAWPKWLKVIAKALQTYGAYVSDSAGSVAVRGVTDVNLGDKTWSWANTPKGPSLSAIPWHRVRVLQIHSCN